MSLFEYVPHPRIASRKLHAVPKVREQHRQGFNGWLARVITEGVGTMWCAYAFAVLALVALPSAIHNGALSIVQWISQTFIQLVLLSIIMVGQQVLGEASDRRAENTYADAEAILQEAQQIQAHLQAQDAALELLADKLGVELEALKIAAAGTQTKATAEPREAPAATSGAAQQALPAGGAA